MAELLIYNIFELNDLPTKSVRVVSTYLCGIHKIFDVISGSVCPRPAQDTQIPGPYGPVC